MRHSVCGSPVGSWWVAPASASVRARWGQHCRWVVVQVVAPCRARITPVSSSVAWRLERGSVALCCFFLLWPLVWLGIVLWLGA